MSLRTIRKVAPTLTARHPEDASGEGSPRIQALLRYAQDDVLFLMAMAPARFCDCLYGQSEKSHPPSPPIILRS